MTPRPSGCRQPGKGMQNLWQRDEAHLSQTAGNPGNFEAAGRREITKKREQGQAISHEIDNARKRRPDSRRKDKNDHCSFARKMAIPQKNGDWMQTAGPGAIPYPALAASKQPMDIVTGNTAGLQSNSTTKVAGRLSGLIRMAEIKESKCVPRKARRRKRPAPVASPARTRREPDCLAAVSAPRRQE